MRLVCFGLPLAPLLLARDGHEILLSVLSPGACLGERRLRRVIGEHIVCYADDIDPTRVELALASADLLVSWFWTRRLPEEWLRLPSRGAVGVHPSLLPRHRGPNPYFWAIDSGDVLTGVSAHWLTAEYDAGDVLLQERIAVSTHDSWQLARALDRPSLRVLRKVLEDLEAARASAIPQDERDVTWAPEPVGDLLRVDWRWSTARVLRRIRALAPVPGLALEVRDVRFFVTRAQATSSYPRALHPGEAAVVGNPRMLVIRTADGAIRVDAAAMMPESGQSSELRLRGTELAGRVEDQLVLDCRVGGS